MKYLNLIFWIIQISFGFAIQLKIQDSLKISEVTVNFVKEVEIVGNSITIVNCDENNFQSIDVINQIAKDLKGLYKLKILNLKSALKLSKDLDRKVEYDESFERSLFTILFVSDYESFKSSLELFKGNFHNSDGFILLVMLKKIVVHPKTLMKDLWSERLVHVQVLIYNQNKEIQMLKYSPFTSEKCGEVVMQKIEKSHIAKSSKRTNFNNCTLSMITRIEMLFVENSTDGILTGFEMSLVNGKRSF